MSVQKKMFEEKQNNFKNKIFGQECFYKWGYWRNGGSFLLYGVELHLPHITRMNALSFWKER